MKLIALVLTSTFAMGVVACGKKAPDAGGTAAPAGGDKGGGDIPANCKKYVDGMNACFEKMPEAGRGMAKDAMQKSMEAWKGMDAAALDSTCKSMLDTAKQSMAAFCGDVKWE